MGLTGSKTPKMIRKRKFPKTYKKENRRKQLCFPVTRLASTNPTNKKRILRCLQNLENSTVNYTYRYVCFTKLRTGGKNAYHYPSTDLEIIKLVATRRW